MWDWQFGRSPVEESKTREEKTHKNIGSLGNVGNLNLKKFFKRAFSETVYGYARDLQQRGQYSSKFKYLLINTPETFKILNLEWTKEILTFSWLDCYVQDEYYFLTFPRLHPICFLFSLWFGLCFLLWVVESFCHDFLVLWWNWVIFNRLINSPYQMNGLALVKIVCLLLNELICKMSIIH